MLTTHKWGVPSNEWVNMHWVVYNVYFMGFFKNYVELCYDQM